MKLVDNVIDQYSDKDDEWMLSFLKWDAPFSESEYGEIIDPDLVNNRTSMYSAIS